MLALGQILLPLVSALIIPLLYLLKINYRFAFMFDGIIACFALIFGGFDVFLVMISFLIYVHIISFFLSGTELSISVLYVAVLSPFFFHLAGVDLLSRLSYYPLLVDPLLTVSYLLNVDILRGAFSYKHAQIADYFLFYPDVLIFCSFYVCLGVSILLTAYVISLFKTGAVQRNR